MYLVANSQVAKLSQLIPSSHGKCQCHFHISETSSPLWSCSLQPGGVLCQHKQGVRDTSSTPHTCTSACGSTTDYFSRMETLRLTVIIWCLEIMGSFLSGILALLLNVVNVGNLISCLNDFHGCAQHPVMALPLYKHLSCNC